MLTIDIVNIQTRNIIVCMTTQYNLGDKNQQNQAAIVYCCAISQTAGDLRKENQSRLSLTTLTSNVIQYHWGGGKPE